VARIAKGFGMKISALDPWVKDEVMEADGIHPVHSVEELYSQNQYVSLHIPATDETRGSIGKKLIEMLPKNGVLINAARKEVIDEAGLAEAMEARPDFRYVADVKPANADELEAKYPERVLFTPKKMGAQTAEANINAGLAAANQVVAHLKDGWNRFQVNK
jgi:D-3-phosphoglycerate dehydrogenase